MKRYLFPAAVVFLLVVIYHKNLLWLWDSWMNKPNYSHGPLIPLIFLFLIWHKRNVLQGLPKGTNAYGLLICLLAIVLQVFSVRAGVNFTSSYSLILLLLGIILFLYGKQVTKVLLFPLGYLVFMVPFFGFVIGPISNKLKLLSSILASNIVQLMEVPILREGTMLHLSGCSLEVADPCSGIRSLMSLLALSALFAYFANGSHVKKLILFCSAIPLAILGNVFRLLILVLTAENSGIVITEGFLHSLTGLLVFMTAIAGLIFVKKLIKC